MEGDLRKSNRLTGKDVKIRLIKINKTQVDLADASGLNVGTLRQMLNGFRAITPRIEKLILSGFIAMEKGAKC